MIIKKEKDYRVFKPEKPNSTNWIVPRLCSETQDNNYSVIEFGSIVSYFLSKIIDIKFYNLPKDIYDVLEEQTELNISDNESIYNVYTNEAQTLIKCINARDKLNEIERYKVYTRWMCFAHIIMYSNAYESTDLDQIFQSDNPCRLVGINESHDIIRKGVTEDGIPCTEFALLGLDQLFILDLWEVLFNKSVKTKYSMCRNKFCECCYETNDFRIKYCPECRKKINSKHKLKLSTETTKLIKKIRGSYNVRIETALVNSNRRTTDEFKKREDLKKYNKLVSELESFTKEIRYYKKRIAGNIVEPNKTYDNSIDSDEKLNNWLKKHIKRKGFKIRIDENGKTNEKSERDRSDS